MGIANPNKTKFQNVTASNLADCIGDGYVSFLNSHFHLKLSTLLP